MVLGVFHQNGVDYIHDNVLKDAYRGDISHVVLHP